jgi:hypothetical protein
MTTPVVTQQLERCNRDRYVAIFPTLAQMDVEELSFPVDIRNTESGTFQKT